MQKRDLDERDPRVKDAVFGKQVEDFLQSDIGNFLLSRANLELEDAIEKLKRIKPNAEHEIRNLQSTIVRSENFMQWLGSAVEDGLRATNQLDGEEDS